MEVIQGKNKDGYISNGEIKFVFSNRLSVFDEVVGEIDGRGKILAECTRILFEYLSRNNIKTAMLSGKDNCIVMEKCTPLYFEFIFRNLLTGSALKRALNGSLKLPDGMKIEEYSAFPEPFVEVSTKREKKDRYNLTSDEIIHIAKMSVPEWSSEDAESLYFKALEKAKEFSHLMTDLFNKAKLLLVDGKIEFGLSKEMELCVIDSFGPDEFRTFDKSWLKSDKSTPPSFYDKEFIRKKLKKVNKEEYDRVLHENGEKLVNLYTEVTERLIKACK